MKFLLLVIALVAGTGLGAGTAILLADTEPPSRAADIPPGPQPRVHDRVTGDFDYSRINNQFVIPVVGEGRVRALVALSLSLEIRKGSGDQVFAREPKLRDVFLRVMFDHANTGGFNGEFTASGTLAVLRRSLLDAGRGILGDVLNDVLITDIARQDS